MQAEGQRIMTMEDYVAEAAPTARRIVERGAELCASLVEAAEARGARSIRFVASGSSYNAVLCALPYMVARLRGLYAVRLETPHEFCCYDSCVRSGELVVVVTQSGISTNALAALDEIRRQNERAVCLTAHPDSDARDHADLLVTWGCGEELVGYVCKGVTTLTAFCMVLADRLMHAEPNCAILDALVSLEDVRARTYAFFDRHVKDFTGMERVFCLAPAGGAGIAREAALKIGETVHVPVQAVEVEEFIHGPNLQLSPTYTCLLFDCADAASPRVHQVYRACREVTDHAFLLTQDSAFAADSNAMVVRALADPSMTSLAYLAAPQLVCHFVNSTMHTSKQHPLIKRFKQIAAAKTASFVNYDGDD